MAIAWTSRSILNEDVDLIFDALVIGDYIEDEEEA